LAAHIQRRGDFATDGFEPSPYAAKRSNADARQMWDMHALRAGIDMSAALVVPEHDIALCALPETEHPAQGRKKLPKGVR